MRNRFAPAAAFVLLFAGPLLAADPASVLRMPGAPDETIAPESLLGKSARDVRVEEGSGNVTIYHGLPLLDVLEKNGLDVKSMASERATAATVVLVSGRDGYTVVFSIGELRMERANPQGLPRRRDVRRTVAGQPGADPPDRPRRPCPVGLRPGEDRAEGPRRKRSAQVNPARSGPV